jgi:PAS domain S-box-containing protein
MPQVSRRILCIDDQSEILDLLKAQLGEQYDCFYATGGDEGLSILQSEGPFAVVMADYMMPEMDGISFLHEVHDRSPDTVSIMLTAHSDLEIAVGALHEGHIFRFLSKPWDPVLLRKTLEDSLEQYRVVVTERNLAADLEKANELLSRKVSQLQQMNSLLQQWVEFSPAVIYNSTCSDGRWNSTYVSKNFSNLVGYERTEVLVNQNFWIDNIHPDDREYVLMELDNAAEEDSGNHICEYRFLHQNGEYRWIQDSFRAVVGALDAPPMMVGAWTDISEHKSDTEPPGAFDDGE